MSGKLAEKAKEVFRESFSRGPDGVVFAPGRVNLIGEHVDYNDGLVLPIPVSAGTAIAWARSDGDRTEAFAADFGETDTFSPNKPEKPHKVDWRSYIRGMAAQMDGGLPAIQLAITGDLPKGSGLSSSASLCIAAGRAYADAVGNSVDATTLARRAQQTEHDYAGVACGIMDQMAVAAGKPGQAMLLDCRDLSYSHVALPESWGVLVIESGVTRGLVEGEYNARRQQCEAAASALGMTSLRDARMEMLEDANLAQPEKNRALHVVGEIARVRQARSAIADANLPEFGRILREGHASLRDLFEVSHPEVDLLVERVQETIGDTGGVRITGAGFGGSVVAVMPRDKVNRVMQDYAGRALRVI
ncbi:MAG: galactokinase [Erythrobacter sp.]|nr:galactokinase [Erythrobacter sp.]